MEKFIKQFGRQPARIKGKSVEYRGFQDLDKVHEQAVRLLTALGVNSYTIEKTPQLKGFTIYF